jgi:hypothetical protein
MSHIFISYSTKNADYAERLAEKLREEGFDVWIDQRRLQTSRDWWRSIVLAIWDCAAFVVILTPESDASEWVQREITLADQRKKTIFPLLLDGDTNTPNWAFFVRTQYADVRSGRLPAPEFYDNLGQYAPRQNRRGADVTDTQTIQTLDDDRELAHEIANPPPQTEMNIQVENLSRERSAPALHTGEGRRSSWRTGLLVVGVVMVVVVIALLVLNNPGNQGAIGLNQTATDTTEPEVSVMIPTSTPTRTPSLTPTSTATLSGTEYELTVRAEINSIQTEGVITQSARETATAAGATSVAQGTADALTATATQWTPTPTPNARFTAEARLTETQAMLNAQSTQISRDQTATATLWTNTPTPNPFEGNPFAAFVRNQDGTSEIYIARYVNSIMTEIRLTFNTYNDFNPIWSPDDNHLAFVSDRDGNNEIYVMNTIDSAITRLTNNSDDDFNPIWSPDGNHLAFVSNRDGNNNIYLMTAAGNNQRPLTLSTANDFDPTWSPDSRMIAFISDRGGNNEIYVINIIDSEITLATGNSANEFDLAWSPNDNFLAYVSDQDGATTIVLTLLNNDPIQITLLNSLVTNQYIFGGFDDLSWSPDGVKLVFTGLNAEGVHSIFTMDVPSFSVISEPVLFIEGGYDLAWRPSP